MGVSSCFGNWGRKKTCSFISNLKKSTASEDIKMEDFNRNMRLLVKEYRVFVDKLKRV